jgi:hypothetical protein
MWWHWWPLWTKIIDVGYSLSTWLRPGDEKDGMIKTSMTNDPNWRCGKSCVMTNVTTAHERDDQSDDQNTTLTTLPTTGDYLGRSMWQPVDNPQHFLDDIWWLHLVIFITKVKSCLSCR